MCIVLKRLVCRSARRTQSGGKHPNFVNLGLPFSQPITRRSCRGPVCPSATRTDTPWLKPGTFVHISWVPVACFRGVCLFTCCSSSTAEQSLSANSKNLLLLHTSMMQELKMTALLLFRFVPYAIMWQLFLCVFDIMSLCWFHKRNQKDSGMLIGFKY